MCAGWLCGFGEVAWLVSDGLAPSMLEWVLALGVSAGSWGLCLAVLGAFRGGHRRGALQVLLVCWPILCGLHGRWAMAVLWAAVAMLALRGRSSLAALAAVVTLAWEVRPALPGEEGPQLLRAPFRDP